MNIQIVCLGTIVNNHFLRILLHFECLFTAAFELLPTGEVFVCPGLNQLEVVCRSDESSFLLWNLTLPALNVTDTRTISSTNMVGTVPSLEVENNVVVKFIIISQPPDPLASRISINLITPILNGGIIMCAERSTSMDQSSEVVLHVVNTNAGLSAHVHNIYYHDRHCMHDSSNFFVSRSSPIIIQILLLSQWSKLVPNSLEETMSQSF